MKETSKAVKASDARRGLSSTSFKFTVEQKGEIKALADELGVSQADALMEAVRSFRSQKKLSNEALLAEIKKRLK